MKQIKREWRGMNKIQKVSLIIFYIFIIWILASWINVVSHNTTDCIYWKYNAFEVFFPSPK